MFNTDAFNYVNVLQKAADASWLREETITNNLANVNTPGYKRKDVDFESVLKRELGNGKYPSLDSKVDNLHLSHLTVSAYVDNAQYSYRLDENNVDVDSENAELASEKIRYQGLTDSINNEFARFTLVLK